jgi:hypothetical protein
VSEKEIREAKDEILAAVQRYQTLAAAEDGDPERTVLDWVVIFHARGFDEVHANGGEYSVAYANHMHLHSILGMLQVGVDCVNDTVIGPDDDD